MHTSTRSLTRSLFPVLLMAGLSQAQSADPAGAPSTPIGQGGAPTWSSGTNALDFVPGSGTCGTNQGQSIGWQFDVTTEVTVTCMSWFDDGQDGLDIAHEVGIFAPGGGLIAATHVTIPAGTGATLDGDWRVVSIPATVLPVGAGYIVGGYNGSHFECLSFNVTQTVHPSLAFVDATYSLLNGIFEVPTNFSAATNGFYGVGFQVDGSGGGGPFTYCNPGNANSVSAGGAVLTSTGGYGTPGATFLISDIPNQPGILYAGTTQPFLAFGCGNRCVGGTVFRGSVLNPTGNQINTAFAMTPGAPFVQYWYRDPANFAACGNVFNLSDALMP